jgi:Holliday junction DNA helicase RuvA
MIASLDGKLVAKGNDFIIVGCQGVGYRVKIPPPVLASVGQTGDAITLYIHTAVREDEISLYGMRSLQELEIFELLLSVSGVGPKVALALIGAMEPSTIANAIAGEQPELLMRVPGVGKRTAERIVIDLKNKIGPFAVGMAPTATSTDADAISALTALGYSVAEAQRALQGLTPGLNLETKIFQALQKLSG